MSYAPDGTRERKCSCPSCRVCGRVRCRDKTGAHPGHRGFFAGVGTKKRPQVEKCKLAELACSCHGAA